MTLSKLLFVIVFIFSNVQTGFAAATFLPSLPEPTLTDRPDPIKTVSQMFRNCTDFSEESLSGTFCFHNNYIVMKALWTVLEADPRAAFAWDEMTDSRTKSREDCAPKKSKKANDPKAISRTKCYYQADTDTLTPILERILLEGGNDETGY